MLSTELVARRLDLHHTLAGFPLPPPCRVRLKFLPVGERWMLLALASPGMPTQVARWLQPFQPDAVHVAPGIAPKMLRANFGKLPPAWERLLSAVVIHYVELTPGGSASIFVEDTPDKVERFVTSIAADPSVVRSRKTQNSSERVKLTARQLDVMSLAVALGYYESPHKVHLRALGAKLGLSAGAVSELLRRGEALIITNFIESLSELDWTASQTVS